VALEQYAAFMAKHLHGSSARIPGGAGLSSRRDQIDERSEDEQIRIACQNLTARQRLKMYRHLYALGCRIDGIERSIEKLTSRST
jgi:hypothetical protein